MTVTTYQALHAVHTSGADRFDTLLIAFERMGPITLIVDEAHHLRRGWRSALFALRERLRDTLLVALTATPPYDAPFAEWSRYEALCGPIDSEISLPELVRNADLCPHQDHIHLSRPHHHEWTLLVARHQAIERLTEALFADAELINCLLAHPWLADPQAHEEDLLDRPEYLTALMIMVHAAGRAIPPAATDLLGIADAALPPLMSDWLERLLQGLIDEPRSKSVLGDDRWRELRSELDDLGLIENQRVTLRESKAIFTAVAGSVAKMDSIVEIARTEANALGGDLCMVILSDRVRANELPKQVHAPFSPTKLGVLPIFETLRRAKVMPDALAVLTGTLVILPAGVLPAFDAETTATRIDPARLNRRALPGCPDHVSLEAKGEIGHALITVVTRLFQSSAIRVLVSTQALLGEGWDAPAINSLILASNAGSYMLSNQMRGRAIRIDLCAPSKVAAIWHLATVFPATSGNPATQGGDIALLARRFEAFEGITNGPSKTVENGIERLALDRAVSADSKNSRTLAQARDREGVAAKWRTSLGGATQRSHVRRVAEAIYAPRTLAWRDTLHALAFSGISGGALSATGVVRQFIGAGNLVTLLIIFLGATFIYSLPKLARAVMLWRRNGSLNAV
jgi:hypothetical protein